jgi:hypothetical protein
MWETCLEIIVAITREHLKYNIILFINIKMVIVKLSNCNKIPYMRPSSLIVVAIKICSYGIQ